MTANDDRQLKRTIPYGYASLVWNPRTCNLVVTLSLTGLEAECSYSAHIRQGSCADTGPVVHFLGDAVADRYGNAFATTTIAGVVTGIPASGWCIFVYGDADLETPIYSGNIANPSPNAHHTQIIRVQLA